MSGRCQVSTIPDIVYDPWPSQMPSRHFIRLCSGVQISKKWGIGVSNQNGINWSHYNLKNSRQVSPVASIWLEIWEMQGRIQKAWLGRGSSVGRGTFPTGRGVWGGSIPRKKWIFRLKWCVLVNSERYFCLFPARKWWIFRPRGGDLVAVEDVLLGKKWIRCQSYGVGKLFTAL